LLPGGFIRTVFATWFTNCGNRLMVRHGRFCASRCWRMAFGH
jgi:hypothetical protein